MATLTMVATVLTFLSCTRSHIFEYEGDCEVYYDIRFKYDYNIKYADAFANEVRSLALYIFDEKDILIDKIVTTDNEELSKEDFHIRLELPAGDYTLLAWGGLGNEESFDMLADEQIGKTTIEQMQVRMQRTYDDEGEAYSDKDLAPLFHGMMELEVVSEPGTYTKTMSLMKNTNVVRVVLHEMSGHAMDSENFTFEITDHSGLYDYDNTRLDDEAITYKPWYIEEIYADFDEPSTRTTNINAVMVEFTIGRMMATESPILRVLNSQTGEQILRLPLAEYMLLIKGNYHNAMGDQEYLDRQDEYSLTLFLDEGVWMSTQIVINGWRVVINDTGLN